MKWAVEYAPGNLRPSTVERYSDSIAKLGPFLAGKYLDEITTKTVVGIVSDLLKTGVTNATIRRDLSALASVLRCTIAWKWRDDNPAKQYDRDIIKETREPIRPPGDWDIWLAVRAAPPMLGRLLMGLYQTGMREEEGGGLQRTMVSHGEILLTRTKWNRVRSVPLSTAALGTFSGTPAHLRSPYWFWHGDGERYRNLATNLAKIIGRAINPPAVKEQRGREWVIVKPAAPKRSVFRPHDLRHRFAIDYLTDHPGQIYELQRILGHSSVKTTEKYLAYLSQNPAQVQRLADNWPFAKPLRHMTYDEAMAAKPLSFAAVL